MIKKFIVCAALVTLSLVNLNAMQDESKIIKILLQAQLDLTDPENPKLKFSGIKDEFVPGRKVVRGQAVTFTYDPENPNEVDIIDAKKAIIGLVAKNPELAEQAGITASDFANAGISQEELQAMQEEPQNEEERVVLNLVMQDLLHGNANVGLNYLLASGIDIVKGGRNAAVGSFILLRKSLEALYKFVAGSLKQAPIN